jgi:type IV pilus assembly protein PilW
VKTQKTHPSRRNEGGFTLVELMISMAIGLFIVLALVTLLANVSRNNGEMGKTNRVIENGRFSLQLLEADVAHTAFWAGYIPQFDDLVRAAVPTDVPSAVPDPCLGLASWDDAYKANLIGVPIQAYEIPAIVPTPSLPVCGTRVVNPQPSTDVLVVRHTDTCAAGVGNCAAATPGDVMMQVDRCTDSSSPNFTSTSFVLGTTSFTLHNRDCLTPADQYRYVSNLYYVRNYAVTPGDAVPTLMRSRFTGTGHAAPEALIEGVQGFRVEFGIDNLSDTGGAVNFGNAITWADTSNLNSPTNRGDGLPDTYVACTTAAPCTADQLMNAVAAKIHVLVRSEKPTPGYTDSKVYCLGSSCPPPTASSCPAAGANPRPLMGPFCDGFKRHLFTQTVRLVNVSTRRETP